MGLESATFIDGLVASNPVGGTDTKAQGDDHIRMIKAVLKATFPNVAGAVTPTQTQLNQAVFPTGTKMLFVQTAAPPGWTKDVTHNDKALRIVNGAVTTGGTVNFSTAFASQAVNGSNAGFALLATHLPAHTHTQTGTFASGIESANHTHDVVGVTDTQGNHAHTYFDPRFAGGGTVPGGGTSGSSQSTGAAGNHAHNIAITSGGNSVNHTHSTTISGQTGSIGGGSTHTHTFTGTPIDLAVKYVDVIIATKD